MILVNKPEKKGQESGSPVFQELKAICMVLGMSKPPATITMMQFFSGIEKKVSCNLNVFLHEYFNKTILFYKHLNSLPFFSFS